jgi:hypothetical protein
VRRALRPVPPSPVPQGLGLADHAALLVLAQRQSQWDTSERHSRGTLGGLQVPLLLLPAPAPDVHAHNRSP